MNYYRWHVGDYAKNTAHLTPMEDLAYRRLLDLYYDSENPIGFDMVSVCRLIRLQDHREAVEQVLHEFFFESPDGWRNKTADEILEAYQAKCLKNKENGQKGGRPKGKTQTVSKKTQTVSKNNPNQEPITNNQEPNNNNATATVFDFKRSLVDLGAPPNLVSEWLAVRRKKKATNSETALKGFLREVNKSGLTLDQALTLCVERSWSGFKSEWIGEQFGNTQSAVNFIQQHTSKGWADGLQ